MVRFAVALRIGEVAVWQQRCLDALFAGGFAEWVAIVDTSSGRDTPRALPFFDIPALRTAGLRTRDQSPKRLRLSDASALHDADVDIVLAFDRHGDLRLSTAARIGVWELSFGDHARANDPPGFWECYRGEPITRIALLQRSAKGCMTVLRDGAVAVNPRSLETSVRRAVMEAATWPAVACRAVAQSIDVGSMSNRDTIAVTAPTVAKGAGAAAALALRAMLAGRWLKHAANMFFSDKWNVGIAYAPIETFLDGAARHWPRVEWIPELPGLDYRADPFGVATSDGRAWALVERYDAKKSRGCIESVPIAAGRWGRSSTTSAFASLHMSYPFMFRHLDRWYCLPESLGRGGVSLHRYEPDGWEKIATLVEREAVDPTIVFHDGRWWLFCTDFAEPRHHRLHAYYADELSGPYVAHPLNPVKVDPRSAGCAGTPFVHEGTLYRPAQDCSRSYGASVVLNRVVELTPTSFREETAAIVAPDHRYPDGVHTLSAFGPFTLVDGKRRAFTLTRVLWRVTAKWRRRNRVVTRHLPEVLPNVSVSLPINT